MFNWLYSKSKWCKPGTQHSFSNWKVSKVLANDQGTIRIYQTRVCERCFYAQIDVQEKG